MALSQKGATYRNRPELHQWNRHLGEALDHLASQIQAVRLQGNYGENGSVSPPSAPTALQVTSTAGLLTASVIHNDAPAGTQYVLQYATSPNFQPPTIISEVLTHTPSILTTWQKSLPVGTSVYLRIAPKFPASPLGPWVYAGTSVSPTLFTV